MSKLKSSTSPILNEEFMQNRKPEPIPFHTFLYNKREGTVLGRSATSWGKFGHHH